MSVAEAAGVLFCVAMAGLTVFQLALIAGAPLGRFAWGGGDRVLPRHKRIGSATSVVLYAAFSVIVLQRAGLLATPLPAGSVTIATWVLAAYLLLGTVLNALSRSPGERAVMTPLAAGLAALTIVVALG